MIALPRTVAASFPRLPLDRLFAGLERMVERRRQRRALLALDDNLLKDIGLSPADAWAEGTKPFWRG